MATTAQAKRDDRRDAILDAARECFLAEGYAATSMSGIAVRLGGSKGTLYNYFKSKEELFDAFVRRACGHLAVNLFSQPEDGRDLRTRLVAMADAFITHLLSADALALYRLVVGEGARFPELGRAFYAAGPQVVQARLQALFADLMAEGRLREADPVVAAAHFKDMAVSGLHHMRLWGVIGDPTREEIAAQAKAAADTFLRAYAPPAFPRGGDGPRVATP